jgi:hypothetical protein
MSMAEGKHIAEQFGPSAACAKEIEADGVALKAAIRAVMLGERLPSVGTADHRQLLRAVRQAVGELQAPNSGLPTFLVSAQLTLLRALLDALQASMACERLQRMAAGASKGLAC